MHEYSMIITRSHKGVDLPMATDQQPIADLYAVRQRRLLGAYGLVGQFTVFSADGLTAKVVNVWETNTDAANFSYPERSDFVAALNQYCRENKISIEHRDAFVPDGEALKIRKIGERLRHSAASLELRKTLETGTV
jgi:hypothetical protein